MRKLSDNFMTALTSGFLSGLTRKVRHDKDLDLEIRENYLNIYYKGNSLLKLDEQASGRYRVGLHQKFSNGLTLPTHLMDEATTDGFLQGIPLLKERIVQYGQSSLETEYEQLLIRANNLEQRTNSDYFVVDRQYAVSSIGRFDLTGFIWERQGRKRGQEVPLCFMELKYALNPDIQNLHEQITRYYESIRADASALAEEVQGVFRQKLALGLFDQPQDRLDALQTLRFSSDIDRYQFIVVLIDYNPYSTLFDLDALKALPFANQIRVFRGGLAMWQTNLTPLSKAVSDESDA